MASLYMQSYTVERNFHPPFVDKGYRYGADFKIDLAGQLAYATIVLSLLWNEDKRLIPGTTRTETKVTDVAIVLSKEGIGWAVIADIPGYEPWVSYKNTVIRFRKQFSVEVPVAPVVSAIPNVGELVDKLEAKRTMRMEAEGILDVVSYVKNLQVRIF